MPRSPRPTAPTPRASGPGPDLAGRAGRALAPVRDPVAREEVDRDEEARLAAGRFGARVLALEDRAIP